LIFGLAVEVSEEGVVVDHGLAQVRAGDSVRRRVDELLLDARPLARVDGLP
jgi:hypothetical protein